MIKLNISLLISLSLFFFITRSNAQDLHKVTSPNEKISFSVLNLSGQISFSVEYHGKSVIKPSKLGIEVNGQDWSKGVEIVKVEKNRQDTTWSPPYGEQSVIRDNYKEILLFLKKGSMKDFLTLIVRVSNEGFAFRYRFTEPSNIYGIHPFHITAETSEYTFAEDTKGWFTPTAQSSYTLLPLKNWQSESERPLTLELPNKLYVSLTEAAMVNYARTKFKLAANKENTIVGQMFGSVDELPPFVTPWRVAIIAEPPGELLQKNELILSLNDPCKIQNTAWIKPGKIIRLMNMTTDGAKKLVDFAVAHNMQYIDLTFWNGNDTTYNATEINVPVRFSANPKALDLKEVFEYSKSRNIGVWLYINQRPLANQLDSLLPLYKSWGIAGIKFGFVHVGSHRWSVWLHDAIKKCAKYQIMVDVHDEYRPTGFSRTYPNLLTQEGILGNEAMPDANHNTTLPFTRFIAGAADYTFCYFEASKVVRSRGSQVIKNTFAHQLALPVIFYSPLQYLLWYDKPESYQGEPEIKFWDDIPTTWDTTIVVAGEIGKYVCIARKSKDRWFLGTITNNESRSVKVPLNFLQKGKTYLATIYSDDPKVKTRTQVAVRTQKLNSKTILNVDLQPSGGQAISMILQEK
jgi:alpha-glucosidase